MNFFASSMSVELSVCLYVCLFYTSFILKSVICFNGKINATDQMAPDGLQMVQERMVRRTRLIVGGFVSGG